MIFLAEYETFSCNLALIMHDINTYLIHRNGNLTSYKSWQTYVTFHATIFKRK